MTFEIIHHIRLTRILSPLAFTGMFCGILLVSSCFAQGVEDQAREDEGNLKIYLQDYLKVGIPKVDKEIRYSFALVDLNDDIVPEVIVFVTGIGWCGSSGCQVYILKPEGSTFDIVSKITLVRLPVRVLPGKNNGWHDLSVFVQGGGILKGYPAVLPFDGLTYASNPTVEPARPLDSTEDPGVIVPLTWDGEFLFQEEHE